MGPHYKSYVTNLNRVRLSEMIDHHALQSRAGRLQPSLIFNPVTKRCYSETVPVVCPAQSASSTLR